MEPRRAPVPAALAVAHVPNSSPPAFTLTRGSDGKSLPAVTLRSPYEFPVEGRPDSHLMRELRWYLECFLDYPFPPETLHAEHTREALKSWGTEVFNALIDRRYADEWFEQSSILQIRSDDPHVLSWPWEALHDPQAGAFIAHQRRVERRLNQVPDPAPLGELPKDRVNILLVIARPYENDVRYRSIGRPLVELIQSAGLPAHVDVLRPNVRSAQGAPSQPPRLLPCAALRRPRGLRRSRRPVLAGSVPGAPGLPGLRKRKGRGRCKIRGGPQHAVARTRGAGRGAERLPIRHAG